MRKLLPLLALLISLPAFAANPMTGTETLSVHHEPWGPNFIVSTAQIAALSNSGGAVLTSASVPFADSLGLLTQDNTNFTYTSASKALYLGGQVGGGTQAILTATTFALGTTAPATNMTADIRGVVAENGEVSNGTTFTIGSTGCANATGLTGGATAGTFTTGASCTSAVIALPTAPNGWICLASNQTNAAHTAVQSANTAASCTLAVTSAGSADVIVFYANGF